MISLGRDVRDIINQHRSTRSLLIDAICDLISFQNCCAIGDWQAGSALSGSVIVKLLEPLIQVIKVRLGGTVLVLPGFRIGIIRANFKASGPSTDKSRYSRDTVASFFNINIEMPYGPRAFGRFALQIIFTLSCVKEIGSESRSRL